jgi:hypothetical protein
LGGLDAGISIRRNEGGKHKRTTQSNDRHDCGGVGRHTTVAQTTQAQTTPPFETFTGTTANLTVGAGQTLEMNVLWWASDDDRNRAIASLKEKGDQ